MEVFPDFEYDHWGPLEGNTTLHRVPTPLHTSLNLSGRQIIDERAAKILYCWLGLMPRMTVWKHNHVW